MSDANYPVGAAASAWPRQGWWRFVLAVAAALILGSGTLEVLHMLGRPLALLLMGGVLAAGLSPVVSWFARWLPRGVAVIIVYGLLALLVIGLGSLIVPGLVEQANAVMARIPDLTTLLQGWLDRWGNLGGTSLRDALPAEVGRHHQPAITTAVWDRQQFV